ncbi:MAG TPA: shikimate dehydrogenase [Ignavibacteriaceae bacterium]|jgi:shikimate dehydrogenase|nr:MAG: Shikimate dehydrogenase [Ignavibacteria bacterium ADurb.Bin266]OQY70693.1 MAG: shikimate dehydrogenase [Ignavibacteriales bacterium UTCHB2]HQF43810.1 shikimate dehydrogenase [Ignavibacteriaceae bacterium]HQI41032.1 shikimate dehydrogenase [Ignavibacteriaceae bacterium]
MQNSFYSNVELIGLLGFPIKQSFSPFIHNIAAELTGTKLIYLPFEVHSSNLKNAVKGITALGIKGFNVTVPHKVAVADFMSKLSEEASITGSVNTVVNELGKLIGYNTDVYGINESLLPYKSQISSNDVCVIGAGGAARSVIYTLIRNFKPKTIYLINRTAEHSESLRQHFKSKMRYDSIITNELQQPDLLNVMNNCSLVVNCTSVGMFPDVDDSVVTNHQLFVKDQIVFDIVYNPVKTKFLQLAESSGATTINGLKMFVLQAAKSFNHWTGVEFPIDKVYKSLLLYVGK